MSVGIPTRDLRQVLESVRVALANPQLATRLLELCERNEAAVERFREEQYELMCRKSEHKEFLARAGREHDERLRAERDAWDRELAERRRRLQMEEDEAARRREAADKDRQAAAALRCRLEQKVHGNDGR
jgi:hypothetical protein